MADLLRLELTPVLVFGSCQAALLRETGYIDGVGRTLSRLLLIFLFRIEAAAPHSNKGYNLSIYDRSDHFNWQ